MWHPRQGRPSKLLPPLCLRPQREGEQVLTFPVLATVTVSAKCGSRAHRPRASLLPRPHHCSRRSWIPIPSPPWAGLIRNTPGGEVDCPWVSFTVGIDSTKVLLVFFGTRDGQLAGWLALQVARIVKEPRDAEHVPATSKSPSL